MAKKKTAPAPSDSKFTIEEKEAIATKVLARHGYTPEQIAEIIDYAFYHPEGTNEAANGR